MTYDAGAHTFSAPQALITSPGENNYYPAYSPDGAYIIFNRATGMAAHPRPGRLSNLRARAILVSTKPGARPQDLPALNGNGDVTNSWPRWSPVIQNYKGHKLVWVTFSSTRDYGLRVRNSIKVADGMGNNVDQVNCFPPSSPQNPDGNRDILWARTATSPRSGWRPST